MLLAVCCFIIYEITAYGGIRSPDSEIVFRTSEEVVNHGSFAVKQGIESWPGFGLARGVDGKQYAIFGPAQALFAAPLIAAGQILVHSGFFSDMVSPLPTSFYINNGLTYFVANRSPPNPDEQMLRWVAMQLNVLFTSFSVALFYIVALRIGGSPPPALFTAVVYGLGTLAWPYSGTFFSEPLSTFFALVTFYLLLRNDPHFGSRSPSAMRTILAGTSLGIAATAHITAILFAPFFFVYALYPYLYHHNKLPVLSLALSFSIGLGAVLTLLGYYNYIRFGSPLETGRGVSPSAVTQFGYGVFTSPVQGIYGLLVSSNKGLLLFSPVVVLATFAWPRLHRLHPFLSNVLITAIVFRIIFIASRSDWHSGYSLGPRYLLMVLPFLCLPLTLLAKDVFRSRHNGRYMLVAGTWLLICQQYYFSLGEIFSYYHLRNWQALSRGVNIFANNQIYLEWAGSPLTSLLTGLRGPFLLRQLGIGNESLFLLGCAVLGAAMTLIYIILWRGEPVTTIQRQRAN